MKGDFMRKFVIVLTIFALMLCLCACNTKMTEMTEEEFAEYRASFLTEYEVCSVRQYVFTMTNNFGGVVDVELCYAFTYIDENGNLKTIDRFQHFEYGLTKVCLGDSNKYVIDNYGETRRYLYLTKDAISSLTE